MTRWMVAALLAWSGCAFSLDGPDPNRPHNKMPKCDTSKGLVALDGLMATASGVAALAFVSSDEPAVALLPLTIGAIYLAGAVSGNKAVDACNKELAIYERGYAGEEQLAEHNEADDTDAEQEREREDRDGEGRRPRRPAQAATGQPSQRPFEQPYPQQPYPDQPPQQVAPPPTPAVQPRPAQTPMMPPQPAQPQPAQPQPAQPQPAPQPPAKSKKQPRPAQQPADDEGDWSDFWREVP